MSGKGKKPEELRSSSAQSLQQQQPSSSRVQRSPPQATSSGEGRSKTGSKGGATSKAENSTGCSLCCVALLSALVAVAAVAGYAAFVAFPTESEQFLREIDYRVRIIVRNVDDFVKTNLDRIRNRGSQSTDEKSPEAQKSSENVHIYHEQHNEGALKEERKELESHGEHGSGNVEEFDHVKPQENVGNVEETLDNTGENFEPETLVVEAEDLGGEIFAQGVTEVVFDDEAAAEFERNLDEELEEEGEEDVDEESEHPLNDPSHRWETIEDLEGATEDATGKRFQESTDDDDVIISEDGREEERQEIGDVVTEIREEEVSEQEDAEEPLVAPHETLHQEEPRQGFPESVATEPTEPIEEEEASAGNPRILLTAERTEEEDDTQEIPRPEQNVPVQGEPEEVRSNQEVFGEEEVGSHEEAPSAPEDEAEVVLPIEELLPLQEIASED